MSTTNAFRRARTDRKMTQAELAIAADVGERTIRKLENGEKVSFETEKAVRAVLDMGEAEKVREARAPHWRVSDGVLVGFRWVGRFYAACFAMQAVLFLWMIASGHAEMFVPQTFVMGGMFVAMLFVYMLRRSLPNGDEGLFFILLSWFIISDATLFSAATCLMLMDIHTLPVLISFFGAVLPATATVPLFLWIATFDRNPSTGERLPGLALRRFDGHRLAMAGRTFACGLLR